MSDEFESLGLSPDAVDALRSVLAVENPDVSAMRARRQLIANAPKLECITPDASKYQIIYARPDKATWADCLSTQFCGIELHDPATGEVATMNLTLGCNYLDSRFYESFEECRDVKRLVAQGAVVASPPGLHRELSTLSAQNLEEFAQAVIFYIHDDAAVLAALRAYLPYMPQGAKRAFVERVVAARTKELELNPPQNTAALVPGGLAVAHGSRAELLAQLGVS